MAEVPLVDLEVIVRYSLAIRQELAPAEEVLAALDESRALVLSLMDGGPGNGDGGEPEEAPVEEPSTTSRADAPALDDVEDVDDEDDRLQRHDRYDLVGREDEDDLEREVVAAEDQVALDDLAGSGDDVDGTPGLDPEPAPVERSRRRGVPRIGTRVRRARADRAEAAAAEEPRPAAAAPPRSDVFAPDEGDQGYLDEVERIRQRRARKARQEAEERQARQAELAERARRAHDAAQARQAADEPRTAPRPRVEELDDVLELPPPLSSDEAARRRAERRRRREAGRSGQA